MSVCSGHRVELDRSTVVELDAGAPTITITKGDLRLGERSQTAGFLVSGD
jgi:hypothetical protein